MKLKFVPETRGSHVHVRVFMGKSSASLALAGTLVLRPEEFEELQATRGVLKQLVFTFDKFRKDVRDKGDEIREEIDEVWLESGGPEALKAAEPYVTDTD